MRNILYRTKRFLRHLVPTPLKRWVVRRYVRSLGASGIGTEPRISFAGVLPPEGKFVRGGKVKLTHLRQKFGQYERGFNILYLVSSTLPPYADIWVQEAHRAGAKVVWNQNGIGCPAWAPETWRTINASMLPIRDADFIAYQSAFAKEGTDRWVSTSPAPHEIVTNCVDTMQFSPASEPPPARPLRLLVMGTHMTQEKVVIPLEALSLLKRDGFEATLSIIGPCEFPGAERLITDTVRKHGLESRVHRAGRFLQHEAPDLYRKHHVFVHLKHMDSSPTAILEAMSCGLPVVGSGSGGLLEWIPPTAGVLLDVPHDWEQLHYPTAEAVAGAVRRIGADWHAWSAGARANAVARFDVADWLNAHERIFTRVLASR